MRLLLLLPFVTLMAFTSFGQETPQPLDQEIELRAQHFDQAKSLSLFVPKEVSSETSTSVSKEVSSANYFGTDFDAESKILTKKPEVLKFELPVGPQESVNIKLFKKDIFSDGHLVKLGSNPDEYLETEQRSVHYWGVVEGKDNSLAAFSFSNTGIMGMFSFKNRTWNIGKLNNESGIYILYEISALKKEVTFECGVSDANIKQKVRTDMAETPSNPENCIRVYVEVDHDIYLNKGDTTAAINYVEGAFSQAFILYANELINTTISEIFVWDVPSPYSGSGSGAYLNGFRSYRNNNGGYNGDLAHLVNLENYGGVAWLDVVCSSSFGYAYSGINSSYQNVPTYSWTVMVIAHEMGHNVGSPHTHACVWNGNSTPIDCCGPEAGYNDGSCGSGFNCTIPLPNQGTVMSYCHLIGGVGIDLNEGFHPQVGTLFQNEVYNSGCLSTCGNEPLLALFSYDNSDICVGSSVSYLDQSTGNVISWDWTFPGGTPSVSTQQNPVIVYNQAGVFDVTLLVTDDNGNTSELSIANAITVVEPPIAQFSATTTGNDAIFTNQSTGATSYLWDFGDGNNSTLENPTHTYTQDGVYSVELSAFNFCGSDTYMEDILIATPPIADLTVSDTEGCEPFTTTFDANQTYNATTYYWEFEGGDPASGTNIIETVTYNSPGTYDVLLIASNPYFSDTLMLPDYITVNTLPGSGFNYSVSERTVDFTNTSTNFSSLMYDFGDGNSSTDENPTHTYAQDGTYTVELSSTNDCGTEIYTVDIVISTLPEAGMIASDSISCQPANIVFDANSSSSNTVSYYWEFEGGNPSSSSNIVETVHYANPGTYDVLLIVENANGNDTLLLQDYIWIQPLPESIYSYFQSGTLVEFFSNPNNYDSLRWHFGDGNTSTLANPVHDYLNAGFYDASLITFNHCGNDTLVQTLNVIGSLGASFTSNLTSGCQPLEVNFQGSANTQSSVDFSWTFEGGSPANSNLQNPTVIYNSHGTYDVSLIVTDGVTSDTLTIQDYISVGAGPSGDFTYDRTGRTVDFALDGDHYAQVFWEFGDGNVSTELNPSHEYDNDGQYTVDLTLMNDCDTHYVTKSIEIATPPIAGFSVDTFEGCIPLEVTFTNMSSSNANAFDWTFEGGTPSTSNLEDPVVTYPAAGTYDVQLIVSSNGGTDTMLLEDFIIVLPEPIADFSYTVDSTTVTFSNNSSEALSYLWDFGDGNTSTEQHPTHTYAAEGSYMITLTAINDCNENSFSREIGTALLPQAEFTVANDRNGCAPFEVEFMNASMGSIDSIQWVFEGGFPDSSNEENPVVVYDLPGNYNVRLLVSNSAGQNELVRNDYITVNELATGDFAYSIQDPLTVNFEGQVYGDTSATVLWHFGNGQTNNQENVLYTYSTSGDYEVMFIVTNECGSDTTVQTVSLQSTSVTNTELEQVQLYPNPASDHFILDKLPSGASLSVMDAYGRRIMERPLTFVQQKVQISAWPSGVYYLSVQYQGVRKDWRLVVQ